MKTMILGVLVMAMACTAFGYDGSIPQPTKTPSRSTASDDQATPSPTKKGHSKSKQAKPHATPTPAHS